jgi:hypothetical protein
MADMGKMLYFVYLLACLTGGALALIVAALS